ncbi:Serine/threonine-protein kinase PknH [Enhygromyxa salina]|uniref:Serine/threonine-protein kinase PknH n=1 Tax=Enhygromyxa salina TaxID=215803 RepID=A0A2S9YGY8_9BACT|nr:serine/threonine-protein kinase [Enhygromyxa salina]PRQ04276.1 Serine/threonine-protein kinase PknH [Enhygromyxa salina]
MAPSPAKTAPEASLEAVSARDLDPEGPEPRAALVVYKGSSPDPDSGPEPPDMPDVDPEHPTLAYGDKHPGEAAQTPSTTLALESDRRRIGDFLVRRLIGEGGMGKVYEAEERLSKRRVALKILRSELSRSEAGRRQFVNEMGILASLDDPHIVRCLHCTEVEGELVMALEYLEGETLRERMTRERALAWDEVVAIAWQICAALEAAHAGEQPIIHRDLKPENVMLVGGGRVKVMDFGIAKIVQAAAGNTTHSVGTLQYMSPEQIDARPLSPRSDLYALGLVMWELLSGRPPFEAESPRVLLDKLCTEPAPQLPAEARRGLPRGVEQLVHQLLEKAPEDRPASAAEVLERLEPFRPAELSGATAPVAAGVTGARSKTEPGSEAETRPGSSASSESSGAAVAGAGAAERASSSGARELAPKRLDTVAVIERAAAPREIPTKLAATIVVSLSLAAGLVTWLIRLLST